MGGDHDDTVGDFDVLKQMLEKRHALAKLLGYASWAAYATQDKMIGSERAVDLLLELRREHGEAYRPAEGLFEAAGWAGYAPLPPGRDAE